MKSLSSSIVVLAGAITLTGGSFVAHGQTALFLQFVGVAVGLIGLGGWIQSLRQAKD